ASVILANTYHLMLRPGVDVVASLGGLHAFTGFAGHILTDSGGFQVFSLGDGVAVDDAGVTFRSTYDGSTHRLTPEDAVAVQGRHAGRDRGRAAGRPAALPRGCRRPGGHDRGVRARRRHVRLRAADAPGPPRHRAHQRGPVADPQRGAVGRLRPARPGVPVLG